MAKAGKKFRKAREGVDQARLYPLAEAVAAVKKLAFAGFDETVELVVTLDIDPKQSDQMVRGTVSLPHGTGKKIRVLAFCPPDRVDEALAAGADHAGCGDLVEKIRGGWLEFDAAVAEKSVMREISSLGKVLGPRGLMPSPKSGTVTDDLPRTIRELKAGKIEIKTSKGGAIQVAAGKVSFGADQLAENILGVMGEIIRLRPATVKGKYIKKAFVCSTMGPALALDTGLLTQDISPA